MTETDPLATPVSPRWNSLVRLLLVVMIAAVVLMTGARLARSWPREAHLGYAEGIWTVMAIDTAKGTFYRPLEGALGYGGTRYFPLFFVLHAGLIRAGLPPIAAGSLLALAAVLALLAAVVAFLRAAGTAWLLAVAAAAVVLASAPTQMALLTIRGDGLAAALTLLGLACVARGRGTRAPAAMFTLAFATKPTSLYGLVAAVAYLAWSGQRQAALRLAAFTTVGIALVLGVMIVASGDRVVPIFAASAAGGTDWRSVMAAPLSLARILRRVPESAFLIQLAGAWILALINRAPKLAVVAWLSCFAATLFIFVSPATVENHLIDLVAIAVLVIVSTAPTAPQWVRVVPALILIGGISALSSMYWRYVTEDVNDMRTPRMAALAAVGDAKASLLVEQPMLAAEAGERAYIIDPYILSLRIARDPATLNLMLDDLRRQRFSAVLLEQTASELTTADVFGDDGSGRFKDVLDRYYHLDTVVEGRPIYRPRNPAPGP